MTTRTIEIIIKAYDFNKPYSSIRRQRNTLTIMTQKIKPKNRGDRKIEIPCQSIQASMAQSMIKKLDKIDRIEVDEDDNSR
jgi:ATP-binding cassette subfamily F protein 3